MEYQANRENPPTMKRSKFSWRGYKGHRIRLTWHILRKEENMIHEEVQKKVCLKTEEQPKDPREDGGTKSRMQGRDKEFWMKEMLKKPTKVKYRPWLMTHGLKAYEYFQGLRVWLNIFVIIITKSLCKLLLCE